MLSLVVKVAFVIEKIRAIRLSLADLSNRLGSASKSIDDILYRIKSAMYATNEDANYFKELDTLDSPQSMKLD